ncbi:MAG: ATP-dependent RecD-like DNA helicase [Clostridiales bacterium]|nr:ATP-dependent RecD-like DNA helicase [Clostridiales bacterium]
MEKLLTTEGVVENIIFANEENGYCVFALSDDEGEGADAELVCVGTLPDIHEGESIRVTGSIINHPSYGRQLSVSAYEKTLPKTERGIEKYLGSGLIKGIGAGLAKRIVKMFGDETFKIIEEEPLRLAEVKGISKGKAMTVGAVFHEQAELRRVIVYLDKYGISPLYGLKIFKKYGEKSIDIVEKNPYRLADEIQGIGFKTADTIAFNMGVEPDSSFRIKAGIKYVLNLASQSGHTYLPLESLLRNTSTVIGVSEELIKDVTAEMGAEQKVFCEKKDDKIRVYLNIYYYAESYAARKLLELDKTAEKIPFDFWQDMKYLEKECSIKLAPEQKAAVQAAMENGVCVITGGPGTGKTTTINAIIKLLSAENAEIVLAAPTGRAAKRMTETTGLEAQTIHRLLGTGFLAENSRHQTFEKDEDNPIEADVVIVDECSMIDLMLFYSLLKAVAHGTRLILVGDSYQLPSVGAGSVLKDVISSGCVKVARLSEVFRQAAQSDIVLNAHKINNGEYPELTKKSNDFFFIKRLDINDVIREIVSLSKDRLHKFLNCDPLKDIQVLTPMRKNPLGVNNLNIVLQNAFNPKSPFKAEKEYRDTVFREGDKVMQIKNNYNIIWQIMENGIVTAEGTGVFNGDEGIIKRISSGEEFIEVVFDENKYVKYDFSQLDELDLSYAVTIHKSQGSEYKAVIIPAFNGPAALLSRNLLYTAVTRARELCVIVGNPAILKKMIDNNKEVNRYSSLCDRLTDMAETII